MHFLRFDKFEFFAQRHNKNAAPVLAHQERREGVDHRVAATLLFYRNRRILSMKTKLPTPQRLPSGQYRCQVMVAGKRVSVVDADPDVCQAKAVAIKTALLQESKRPESLTVGEAIDRYIESKDSVLSPATIYGYKKLRKNTMQGIIKTPLSALTQEKVQREMNTMAKTLSPKTIRNAHGLLSAALAEYHPTMILRTTLPQKKKYEAGDTVSRRYRKDR